MIKKLAIVIPAYKSAFLKKTVDSVINQNNQQFNLYIGVDGSLNDTINILEPYKNKENVFIHVFEENLGGKDLVAQWERCIALSKDEAYIWLFPDDDIMNSNCVREFYNFIEIKSNQVMRFPTCRINEDEQQISPLQNLLSFETSDEFMKSRIFEGQHSSVAEYIFPRKLYNKYKGFYNLPAAWGSDDITWYLYSKKNGIHTLHSGYVAIRHSNTNISGSPSYFAAKKMMAIYLRFKFLYHDGFFERMKMKFNKTEEYEQVLKKKLVAIYQVNQFYFPLKFIFLFSLLQHKILGDGIIKNMYRVWYYNRCLIKRRLV